MTHVVDEALPWVLVDGSVVQPDPHWERGHGRHRYKARKREHQCRCDVCRADVQVAIKQYRDRVKAEVRSGQRPPPNWMVGAKRRSQLAEQLRQEERARVRDQNRHRAAVAVTRILKAFEDQLEFDREYLPAHGPRRAQLLVRIYVDEPAAGRWREKGAGS